MDNIFVVSYRGSPYAVAWSRRSALSQIPFGKTDDEEYQVTEVPLQPIYAFITEAMFWAAEHTPEDRTPVVVPGPNDALDWAVSEVGEAVGARVAKMAQWKRNNPDKHLDEQLDWEIGQAIMMLCLASAASPIAVIREQLASWGWLDA